MFVMTFPLSQHTHTYVCVYINIMYTMNPKHGRDTRGTPTVERHYVGLWIMLHL